MLASRCNYTHCDISSNASSVAHTRYVKVSLSAIRDLFTTTRYLAVRWLYSATAELGRSLCGWLGSLP